MIEKIKEIVYKYVDFKEERSNDLTASVVLTTLRKVIKPNDFFIEPIFIEDKIYLMNFKQGEGISSDRATFTNNFLCKWTGETLEDQSEETIKAIYDVLTKYE